MAVAQPRSCTTRLLRAPNPHPPTPSPSRPPPLSTDHPSQVLGLLAAAGAVLALMLRFGKHLVDAPRLRPDLASPWQ